MIAIFLLAFTLSLFSFGTTPAAAGDVAGVSTHLFLTVLRDYDHDAAFSVTYTDALGTHTKPYHAGMEVTAWSPVTITCTNHHVHDWSIDADVQEATIVGVGGITYPGGTGIHVKGTNTIKAFATNFGLHYINIVVILGEGNDNGGNNGGDGYAAARLWCSGGGQADVWEVTSAVRGDALTNRTLALLHGVRVLPSVDAVDVAEYAAVVDALYGTGLNHAIEGDAAILIHRLNDHPQIPVIAVDIPSGLDGTTGRALGADVVRAAETVTFHRIKQGLLLRQGVEYTGKITVQPILIRPGDDIDLGFDGLETLSPAALAPLFARTPALHKGDCGRAVIFCGSRGMVGAAAFCANACIRAGAGLTTLLCRESLLPMLQVLAPGATCVPLPETNGLLTPQAARITRETLDKADAACIGCGCGLTPDVTMLLRVFAEADCPIVWDADALTLLATHDGILPLKEEDIITPHPGEAARLLEQHVEFILDEPLDALSRLHDLCGCCVLLKGARTLVSDGDATYISLYGTPALAKGGSGDVLSGILTALLCQRNRLSTSLSTSALAAYGVLIHALAGLRAEKRFGANCSTPQALIDAIRLDDKEL